MLRFQCIPLKSFYQEELNLTPLLPWKSDEGTIRNGNKVHNFELTYKVSRWQIPT